MHARAICEVLDSGEVFSLGARDGIDIREGWVFADKIDDIHTKATDSSIQPECHDIVKSSPNVWVFPVEVGLFWCE